MASGSMVSKAALGRLENPMKQKNGNHESQGISWMLEWDTKEECDGKDEAEKGNGWVGPIKTAFTPCSRP